MRFFYKLIIGLILFNSFLIIFSNPSLIPNVTTHNAKDISGDANYSTYKYDLRAVIGNVIGNNIVTVGTLFGVLLTAGAVISIFTGINMPLYIGISLIVSIVSSLYMMMMDVFTDLMNYPIVSAIWVLLTIIIGIYFVFSLGDILLGRSDAD